jgi:hypothetical protein
VETGHFQLGANGDNDADDAPCFSTSPISILAGCVGSDLDFDGTSYQADWPNGTEHNATSLAFTAPRSAVNGSSNYRTKYPILQFETDVLASEVGCQPDGSGCTVPPAGANFYPFYSVSGGDASAQMNTSGAASSGGGCVFEFGNLTHDVQNFGKDAQYGTSNLPWFFGTASGDLQANACLDG